MTLNILLDKEDNKETKFREIINTNKLVDLYNCATVKTAFQMTDNYNKRHSEVWKYAENHAFKCIKKYIKRQC